jgi:hypothetical protein
MNSTAHGMSGNGNALPESEYEQIRRRYDEVCDSRAPANVFEFHVIWRFCTHWILHEKCEERRALIYTNESYRACWDWDTMCRAQVQQQVGLLTQDPARAVAELLESPLGCDALIQQWDGLDGFLEKNGCWTPEQRQRALDLLGIDSFVRDSGRTVFDPRPGDGTTFQSRAQEVIRRELAQLRERAALPALHRTVERQRENTVAQLEILDSRKARLAERYRAEQARRMQWWWRVLEKLQSRPGRERSRQSRASMEEAAQKRASDEMTRLLREAGVIQEGQEPPKWSQTTEKDMVEAAKRFAEYGALKAAAEAAAQAAEAKIAAEAQAASEVDPEVAEVLDNGPVIPVAATPSPEAPQATESLSIKQPGPKPEKPLSRKERREKERLERQEDRRRKQSWASAYNSPYPPPSQPLVG